LGKAILWVLIYLSLPTLIFAQQNQSPSVDYRPKTILDFKDELGLTLKQVDKIKVILYDFEKETSSLQKRIVLQNNRIIDLLEKESDLKEIRNEVNKVFSMRADLVMLELETARKIDALLTKKQLKKWREIKRKPDKR
jgi:Spy/CpxP family protein refolding chaperone